MLSRRELMAGGALAAGAGLGADDAETNSLLREIAGHLAHLNNCRPELCPELVRIREARRTFLKNSSKFPDFIDVGLDVWERLIDWKTNMGQPLEITRTGDGRYTTVYQNTRIVLRPDATDNFVGVGYDDRP